MSAADPLLPGDYHSPEVLAELDAAVNGVAPLPRKGVRSVALRRFGLSWLVEVECLSARVYVSRDGSRTHVGTFAGSLASWETSGDEHGLSRFVRPVDVGGATQRVTRFVGPDHRTKGGPTLCDSPSEALYPSALAVARVVLEQLGEFAAFEAVHVAPTIAPTGEP